MKNHGFKSVFEVCAALLAQYIAFYMISSRLGKEAEIENFLTNKFVMIFWEPVLANGAENLMVGRELLFFLLTLRTGLPELAGS